MTPVNPLDGLGAILKADPDLAALVGASVFWPSLPRQTDPAMPAPAVVIRPAGGYMRYGGGTLPIGDPRVDTDCYGATLAQSWQVHLAVLTAFKRTIRATAGGVLVHSVTVSSGGVTSVDPDTQWPLTIASYTAVISELPVS